jgi:hypothetical protein
MKKKPAYPGQYLGLTFPSNPIAGQEFLADNNVTYVYTGDRWSSALAVQTGRIAQVLDGSFALTLFNPDLDKDLEGGGA